MPINIFFNLQEVEELHEQCSLAVDLVRTGKEIRVPVSTNKIISTINELLGIALLCTDFLSDLVFINKTVTD